MRREAIPISCRELDLAAVQAELVKHRCNVAAAARALGVPSSDLRRLVSWGPLAAVAIEQVEQAIDDAEKVLRDGLKSPDLTMRLKAAATLLALSPTARQRGWGRCGTIQQSSKAPGEVTLRWRDS
jgi:hypothetical protein